MSNHQESELSLQRIACAAVAAAVLLCAHWVSGSTQLILCLIAYLLVGWPILRESLEHILHGEVFDENFLMSVASIGAFCIGEYPEAVAVMLLYTIGEALQDRALGSSQDAIRALLALRVDCVNLLTEEGLQKVEAQSVAVGDHIVVRPGERIGLDGIIRQGSASVDTAMLTGESLPRHWTVGDPALAGCVSCDGVLEIEVTKPFGRSGADRILELVEEAQETKAKPERFITRFSKVYTPAVCAMALVVAVIPPLLQWGSWSLFLHKALAFLVISCPCALVISVPLCFFAGIGCAGSNGILIKGSSYLEALSKAEVAVFDKTGTLTQGKLRIHSVHPASGVAAEQLLETAALCEHQSNHPLAQAICGAYGREPDAGRLRQLREIAGGGISAMLDGKPALVGSAALLSEFHPAKTDETAIHLAWDGRYLGYITFSDALKPEAQRCIQALKKAGFHDLTMLSGDRQAAAQKVGDALGLDHVYGELMPEEKLAKLRAFGGRVLYAGDGINDAPVLAGADVGIAMGALGSDAAIEAADLVIMSDDLMRIPSAVHIARKTMRIARENIVFSILVKGIILLVSAAANVGLWLAVFADVGVCMLAILNALRVMRLRTNA